MELNFPNRTCMNINKCMSATWVNEIPELNCLVSTTCNAMRSSWMKIYRTDPIFVSFASHDIFLILQVPDLPLAVITCSGNNLFFSMESHSSNSSGMGFNFFLAGSSLVEWCLKLFSQIWIISSILWPRCILTFNLCMLFHSATHSLFFHGSVNLLLNFFFLQFDGSLNLSYSFLSLILFKF